MGVENDVTKKIAQLEENKDVAGLEEVKNDAEAGFDGETVGLAEQAISRLNTKVEKITPPVETTEGQKTQVENMGGSESDLQEVTAPVDEKIAEKDKEIEKFEAETEQKINEIKQETSEKTVTNPELQKELEQTKKNEKYWNQQINKVQEKQFELVNYEHFKEFAKQKLDKVAEYQTKYQDLLDKKITTFPASEKYFNERISFNDLSEYDNKDLIYKRNIGELVVDVMQAYSSRHNKNPQRIFEAKKETTLRELLTEYKTFLENQLAIPKPTQTEIDANQAEGNMAWDYYKKSQEEVKNIEKMTDLENQNIENNEKNQTREKIAEVRNENNEINFKSILDEANDGIKSGAEMFNALKNEGGDAVQRRIDSLSADFRTNSPIIKSLIGLEKYEHILNASPEEIKNIYYKDFEGQNSIHEIGAVLSGINSESFKEGFFNALNNKPNELSDKLSLKIKIIDKILSARKIWEQGEIGKTETQEINMEEKNKEYENKVFGLMTEGLKLDAQLDYIFLKNDIPSFTKLLIQKFEKEIERIKLNNEQFKERNLIEEKIKAYEKRIESAKKDVTGLYEYNTRVDGSGSSSNEKISGLAPSQLVDKYNREIKHLIEVNEKHDPSGKYDGFPHKFDKLEGLIDIAKQKGDVDVLNSIKRLTIKLPDKIKDKLNS